MGFCSEQQRKYCHIKWSHQQNIIKFVKDSLQASQILLLNIDPLVCDEVCSVFRHKMQEGQLVFVPDSLFTVTPRLGKQLAVLLHLSAMLLMFFFFFFFHLYGFVCQHCLKKFNFQAELEESDHKDGPEIEDAQSTITDVEQLFQTTDA